MINILNKKYFQANLQQSIRHLREKIRPWKFYTLTVGSWLSTNQNEWDQYKIAVKIANVPRGAYMLRQREKVQGEALVKVWNPNNKTFYNQIKK